MKWVDSHTHLNDEAFSNDLEEVLKRAQDRGVEWMVVPGYDLNSSLRAVELSEKYKGFVFAAVGWHPHDAARLKECEWEELVSLTKTDTVVAIGETGLDYFKDYSPREVQRGVFERHIELALKRNLPLVIHVRDAFEDVFYLLSKHRGVRGVLHCFSGGREEAKRGVEMGFYVSFSGLITFGPRRVKEALLEVERERLLIETDAPYLAPHPFRGKRNEPSYLLSVGKKVAEILNVSPAFVSELTVKNAYQLFRPDRTP